MIFMKWYIWYIHTQYLLSWQQSSVIYLNLDVRFKDEASFTTIHDPSNKSRFQNYLYCQLREILSIYRPAISFHENHQFVQGWNPTTTTKIKILKNEIYSFAKIWWKKCAILEPCCKVQLCHATLHLWICPSPLTPPLLHCPPHYPTPPQWKPA